VTLKYALEELELLPTDRLEIAFQSATDRSEPLHSRLLGSDRITDDNMKWLQLHYGARQVKKTAAAGNVADIKRVFQPFIAQAGRGQVEASDVPHESPVGQTTSELVDHLLHYAHQEAASEVILEPREGEAVARIRVDGLMRELTRYPSSLHDEIVTQLKIRAGLRTEERFALQKGRLREVLDREAVEFRVEIVPIMEGEKVVMRLLTEQGKNFSMDTIGLSEADDRKIIEALRSTSGMILCAGRVGSGTSTTLRALLKILSAVGADITSLEEPIDHDLSGVSQLQLDSARGLTAAIGIQAMEGQEHGILSLSDLRDEDTATLAINAASDGPLLLSTLHSVSAADALVRMLDMGVEPSLVISSIGLIIAQRLVPKICPSCIRSAEMDLNEAKKMRLSGAFITRLFGKEKKVTVYAGAKCAQCKYTGTLGRIGIFELLEISEPLRELIQKTAPDLLRAQNGRRVLADRIEREAIRQGMRPMLDDGIGKVQSGTTSVEELQRAMSL
jgi:type IV pilus assembly protein PilB